MLSKRLDAVAGMVTPGNVIADIGTDHGYVPIYLVKNGICPKAYAMDINEGPVKIARQNIKEEGLEDKIEVIQSDGMEKLEPNMAETVVIAGMGGELIVNILKMSKVNHTVKEFVLSPHKRPDMVRRYVIEQGWYITDEKMILEAGKFYTVMKVARQNGVETNVNSEQICGNKEWVRDNTEQVCGNEEQPYSNVEYLYGRVLLKEKNPVLREFLETENKKFQIALQNMKESGNDATSRVEEILENIEKGRKAYD